MKVSKLSALTILALLAGTFALTRSMAQPAPDPAPAATKVAVCDVVEIFNNYQRAKDLTAKLNERRTAIQTENNERGKKIDDMEDELKALKPGSKEYEGRFNERQRLIIERDAWLKFQETLAIREHHRLTEEMYNEIQDVIAALAKDRGFHIVLFRDPKNLVSQSTAELLQQINLRKVLYSDNSVDLTEDVLRRLNETYRAAPK